MNAPNEEKKTEQKSELSAQTPVENSEAALPDVSPKNTAPEPAENIPSINEVPLTPTSENETPASVVIPDDPASQLSQESNEPQRKRRYDPGSFALQCLNYLSFGRYYFVLAKKKEENDIDKKTDDDKEAPALKSDDFFLTNFQKQKASPESKANKIFFVPGSKDKMRKEVMRFLKKADIEPIISRVRLNYTESMEQKFKDNPHVHFALVILTGDDFVYHKDSKPANANLRTAQTTVFELGYYLAKLGRQNVFILYYEQKNFLLPTDMLSAVYTPYNQYGHWKKELVDRLLMAGFSIDKNILLQ